MIQAYLSAVFVRDLEGLKRELAAYTPQERMWDLSGGVHNSTGGLALHLAGNLRHFVGATLGGTGYQRDRDAEFSTRCSREELIALLDTTIEEVRATMAKVTDAQLQAPMGSRGVNALDFLLHLATHLSYHLGQVDYHRRLVGDNGDNLHILSIGELATAPSE